MENTDKKLLTWHEYSYYNGNSALQTDASTQALKLLQEVEPTVTRADFLNDLESAHAYVLYCLANGVEATELGTVRKDDWVSEMIAKIMRECTGCKNKYIKRTMTNVRSTGNFYCKECTKESTAMCKGCTNVYFETDPNINVILRNGKAIWGCSRCFQQTIHRINHRAWVRDVIGKGVGNTVQSARGFGVEIECYYTDNQLMANQLAKLPTTFGIARDGSLDPHVGKKTPDGRVMTHAFELTTPILKGTDGEEYLRALCRTINYKDNAQVTERCGLHIHLDMADCSRNVEVLKRILVFHWIYESVIMSFLPATRRANEYCKSLKNDYHLGKIIEAQDIVQLYNYWYKGTENAGRFDHATNTRYHGLNFHEVFANNNVEIRYHSGTTNAKKMLHWVNLHARIIDYCAGKINSTPKTETLVTEGLTALGNPRTLSKLTTQLFEMLQMSDECVAYFKDRQKTFLKQKNSKEVEFIEKEPMEFEGEEGQSLSPYQLTLSQYDTLLAKRQEVL